MATGDLQLELRLDIPGADDPELDRLSELFAEEVRESGVSTLSALPGTQDVPGAKGDVVELAAYVATVAPAVLPAVLSVLSAWRGSRKDTHVTLTTPAGAVIEIDGDVAAAHIQELVEQVLAEDAHA